MLTWRIPRGSGLSLRPRFSRACRARFEALEPRTLFQAGDLDATFNVDGMATVPLAGRTLNATDVAVQSGGRPVVAGSAVDGNNRTITLARFLSDGTPDTSFGGDGVSDYTLSTYLSFEVERVGVRAVAVQPDDKIVVVGTMTPKGLTPNSLIARFLADGTPDSSFSGDGLDVIFDFDGNFVETSAADVAIQADGKIVVAGSSESGSTQDFDHDISLARYNTNGTLDNTFDGNGKRIVDFGENVLADALTIDAGGRIVVAGEQYPQSNPSDSRLAVARLNTNGSLDGTFSGDGKLATQFGAGSTYSTATGVAVQPSGKIVVAGEIGTADTASRNFGVTRFNSNGTLDTTFGPSGNGLADIEFSGGRDAAHDLMIGQTGELIVSGAAGAFPSEQMALACLTADGVPDPVFSGDGKVTIPFSSRAVAAGLAAAPGGRIFTAGGDEFATAKFFDRAPATVSITTSDAVGTEAGPTTANFVVLRAEPLANITSVLIFVSGSARAPGQGVNPDYVGFSATPGSNFVEVMAGAPNVLTLITPRDDALIEGDENAVFTILPRLGIYDIAQPASVTLTIRDNDVTGGPVVGSSTYVFDGGPPQRVRFSFSQDVVGSIGSNDFGVTGPSGPVPFSLGYDSITNTATLSLSGGLPNGNYTARAIAAGLTNAAGTPMAADSALSFFILAGDVDRNRTVNGSDFAILAGNFGKAGQTYATGDLDGDGSVNGGDFALLAGNFGRTVPAPAAVAAGSAAPPATRALPASRQPPAPTGPGTAAPVKLHTPRRRALRLTIGRLLGS